MIVGNPKDPKRNSEGYADPTAYMGMSYTVEEEKAKRFLSQYYSMRKKIDMLDKDIEELEAEAESINVKMDGMPRSTNISDKTGRLATTLAEYYMNRIELRNDLWQKRKEIVDVIEHVENVDYQELLRLRYIQNRKWENIAVELDKSWRHTHRMHRYALQEAGKILKKMYPCH